MATLPNLSNFKCGQYFRLTNNRAFTVGREEGLEGNNAKEEMFLAEKEPKQRKHKSEKIIVFGHSMAHDSRVLTNEPNWSNTDWAKEASEVKSLLSKTINVINIQKTLIYSEGWQY